MTDFKRKHEFVMTKCWVQFLTVLTSLGISKLVGFFFLLPKNPKLYADHFFNPGYLDLNGFEVKSNAKIEEGSTFSSDEKDVIITHYGTAPVDPCRPQNRGSHDYLRAHKGSRRMSRPLIQDSSAIGYCFHDTKVI